jgi:hypothetical protein
MASSSSSSRAHGKRRSGSAALLLAIALAVGAGDAAAQGAPAWPSFSVAPQVAADGTKDAALVIGVEDYAFIPHVDGAAQNARDWFSFLVDGQKVPISRAHLLRNRDASRETILATAEQVAREVEPGGKIWVVFIGHGAPAADGKDGVLVGVDAQQTAVSLYARSVAQKELIAKLGGAPAIFVVDACFSGRTGSGAPIVPGTQPMILANAPTPAEVTVLSAGKSDQFAGSLPGTNRPAFSYLVLGALRGWADKSGKGAVTAQEAVDYARGALAVLPIGRSQTPELHGANGALALSHGGREKGPSIERVVEGTELAVVAPTTESSRARVPVAGGPARIRVRATCGNDPKPVAARQGLALLEITDAQDVPLPPASDPNPTIKYDDATHQRVMTDPEFVDYDLTAGPHRLRVLSTQCHPYEERVVLPAGKTVEFAPRMTPNAPPVDFRRPVLAAPADHVKLVDKSGKILCEELPCKHEVPVQSGYSIVWARGGATLEAELPERIEVPDDKSARIATQYEHKRSGAAVPLIVTGSVVGVLGGVVFALAGKSCTAMSFSGGAYGSTDCNESGLTSKTTSLSAGGDASIGLMAGGGALLTLGIVMAATGVLGKDALTLHVETAGQAPATKAQATITPLGVTGSF